MAKEKTAVLTVITTDGKTETLTVEGFDIGEEGTFSADVGDTTHFWPFQNVVKASVQGELDDE